MGALNIFQNTIQNSLSFIHLGLSNGIRISCMTVNLYVDRNSSGAINIVLMPIRKIRVQSRSDDPLDSCSRY